MEEDNENEELEDRIDEEEWETRQKTLIHKDKQEQQHQQPKFTRSSRGGRRDSGDRERGGRRGGGRGKRNNH